MGWIYLVIAGIFEIVFTMSLKMTHQGFKLFSVVLLCVSALTSFGLLWLSLKTIPIGTAYAVWTGMGVIGAASFGVLLYNEPATFGRLFCIFLIAAGGIGLRLLGVQK